MRLQHIDKVIALARALAGSAEGMTLDEMGQATGLQRRTVERMRDALQRLCPKMEEVRDPPTKRWRIPGGLELFQESPTAQELDMLVSLSKRLRTAGEVAEANVLEGLERKVRAAVRADYAVEV